MQRQRKLYNEKIRENSQSPKRRLKRNADKKASPKWNKYSRHKRSTSGSVSPVRNKSTRPERDENPLKFSSPDRKATRRKARKPRPRDLFPKNTSLKPSNLTEASMKTVNEDRKLPKTGNEAENNAGLPTEDDSIMSFEDVEKWIFEQEQHFSQSNLLNDSMCSTITDDDESSPQRKPKKSQQRTSAAIAEPEKQSLQEKIDFYEGPKSKQGHSRPEKPRTKDRRLSSKSVFQENIISTAEEDDAFLEDLLMEDGECIKSVISPMGKFR